MRFEPLIRRLVMGRSARLALPALALFAAGAACAAPPPPQETAPDTSQETVVNLAAGRVLVAVSKGALIVGTVEDAIETDTHPPIPVQIGSSRIGVVLGAVEWIAPVTKQQLARLDQELPRLRAGEAQGALTPHLGSRAGTEATDLEAVGDGLFARLNGLVRNLHGKVDLAPGAPIVELIIADYLPGYGPEVWRLDYAIQQDEESVGYWTTRALRPTYTQCWPPEKGQPRAMLQFAYPPSGDACGAAASKALLKGDSRIAHPDGVTTQIIEGDSSKVPAADAIQAVRFAADALASSRQARETIASLGEETGFQWILAPPAEAVKPGLQPERPAGAPSLVAPPHP